MGYSERALSFSQIPLSQQIRFEDRVSFLYLEHARVHGDRTGVWALGVEAEADQRPRRPWSGHLQLPIVGIASLMLGPGTSVTQPAMTTLARSGVTVMFTGGGGYPLYAAATPGTASGRWAIAQATMWSDHTHLVKAARTLYAARFPGMDADSHLTDLNALRGLEGRLVRDAYQRQARLNKLPYFKRDTASPDPVNASLNMCNAILYGMAASVCATLSLNPALGVIHRGDVHALIHDIADVYKLEVSVPAAFSSANQQEPASYARHATRAAIHQQRVMTRMFRLVTDIFTPHLPSREGDTLIGETTETQHDAHTNYAGPP